MYEADSEISQSFQPNSSSDHSVLTQRPSSSGKSETCSPTDTTEKYKTINTRSISFENKILVLKTNKFFCATREFLRR